MNYLEHIHQLFCFSSFDIAERMKYVNIKFSSNPSNLPSYKDLNALISSFPSRDLLTIVMNDDSENSLRITSTSICSPDCYADYKAALFEGDPVYITIEIEKQVYGNHMSVYCFREFCSDLLSLSYSDILAAFTALFSEATHLYFEVFDEDIFFKTGTMAFSSANHNIIWGLSDRSLMLDKCRTASNFYHQSSYHLIPEDFNIEIDYADNPLTILFSQLCTVLSLAYLASNSAIVNDELQIQITGQRSVDFVLPLEKIHSNAELYKIYHWIFTDGNAVDKALLARNSISAHCKFTEISNLDGKTFASILANYNLYLKDNVSKYIELTNAMAGFIQESTNNVSACISDLFDRLKSNLLAVVSFIFTVVLANIVSDQPLDNIFTYEVTIIMYLVFAGSLVYFMISLWETHCKMKRMSKQYDDLISHYSIILSSEDIKQISADGQPIRKAQSELMSGMIGLSIIWLVLLVFAFTLVDTVGDGPHIINTLLSTLEKLTVFFVSSFKAQ